MLVGDAGMGKTRTAEQLAALATDEGFRVLWGSCQEEEGTPPYWPWIQAFRAYTEAEGSNGHSFTDEADMHTVGELTRRLGGWTRVPEHASGILPETARFRLFDAVNMFLQRAAQHRPILLVFDDLHAADQSSLHLLAFIARGLSRAQILIVGTCRPSSPSRRQSIFDALNQTALQTLPLEGLDRSAVRQLMTDTVGEPPSRALLRSVVDLTEGNPFFVKEIARWLAHERLTSENSVPRGPIPESVNAVISRHLDQLLDSTREALRIAALLGRDVDYGLLQNVRGEEHGSNLLEALDDAVHAQVLHEHVAKGRYRFRHELIRQVLYEELAPGVRARLHARAAAILETEYGAVAEHHATELAFHFAKGQYLLGPEKVAHYSRVAGEQCFAVHAYDEAAVHFERALACRMKHPVDAETAGLFYGLGCAKAATSLRWNRQEAWECLKQACEYYIAVGDSDRAVAAVTQAAITAEAVTGVVAVIERVRGLVAPDSRAAGWLLARLAAARYFETGDYAAASQSFTQALAIARSAGDDALELRTLALGTAVDHFDLRWSDVEEKCQRVIHFARLIDDPHAETYARYRLAFALAFTGRATEAWPEAQTNLAEAEKLADDGLLEDALYVNAALAQLQGNWSDARQFSDRGPDLAPHHLALLHLRVLLEFELGETAQGREYLARLLRASSHAGPYSLREAYRAVVGPQIGLLGEEPGPLGMGSALPPANPNAMAMLTVGRALAAVQASNVPESQSALRLLVSRKGSILAPPLVTDRLLGLLSHTVGRFDEAAAHCEESVSFCRGAGYKPELAWSCYDHARCLLARDQKGDRAQAVSLLDEAEAIALHLGMFPLHGRVAAIRQRYQAKFDRQPDALSRREVKVAQLIASGKTNQEIASDLFISTHTVAAHVAHILAKTGCRNRTEAAAYAVRELSPDPSGQN